MPDVMSPLGARAVLGLSVCVSVCRSLFWHYKLRGDPVAYPGGGTAVFEHPPQRLPH